MKMYNIWKRLQEIKEANDRGEQFNVREMIGKLQRELSIGDIVETFHSVKVLSNQN